MLICSKMSILQSQYCKRKELKESLGGYRDLLNNLLLKSRYFGWHAVDFAMAVLDQSNCATKLAWTLHADCKRPFGDFCACFRKELIFYHAPGPARISFPKFC